MPLLEFTLGVFLEVLEGSLSGKAPLHSVLLGLLVPLLGSPAQV